MAPRASRHCRLSPCCQAAAAALGPAAQLSCRVLPFALTRRQVAPSKYVATEMLWLKHFMAPSNCKFSDLQQGRRAPKARAHARPAAALRLLAAATPSARRRRHQGPPSAGGPPGGPQGRASAPPGHLALAHSGRRPAAHPPFQLQVVGGSFHQDEQEVMGEIIDFGSNKYDPPWVPPDVLEALDLVVTKPEIWCAAGGCPRPKEHSERARGPPRRGRWTGLRGAGARGA